QSLSNRPTDALVTLKRLAGMGVVYDAATNEDLRQVRALPGWPQIAALIGGLAGSDVASRTTTRASVPPVATPPTPTAIVGGPKTEELTAVEAVHFSAPGYVPVDVAYDAVAR